MSTANERTVNEELRFLLHPADKRDIPVPGFPPHDALIAWARSQPADQLIDAAIQVLGENEWPQQYAAMALLRAMGAQVEGDDEEGPFRWRLSVPGRGTLVVEPIEHHRPQPDPPLAPQDIGAFDELKAGLATAISQLDEPERIILTLFYYERLPFGSIARVLGVAEREVRLRHRGALDRIRIKLTESAWVSVQDRARTTPASAEAGGALALIQDLVAAA